MDPSQKSFLGARLFVIAALALTAWALVFKTGVANTDEAGIVLQLPAQVGDWDGLDLLFAPTGTAAASISPRGWKRPASAPAAGRRWAT